MGHRGSDRCSLPFWKMLDKDLLARFWKDFHLTTQDEDTSFPIANPQDAARVLVKCRNWIGTFTELLISRNNIRNVVLKSLKHERSLLSEIEQFWYADFLASGHPVSTLKTRELAQALIAQHTKDDTAYHSIKANIITLENELNEFDIDIENLEALLKRIEKTTDYLVQYLNWVKYEVRTLQ